MIPFASGDFPFELRLAIFERLPVDDLLSLARVCKALLPAARHVLYANITMEWKGYHQPPLALLLKALLSKPVVAQGIQSLHFKGDSFKSDNCIGPRKTAVPAFPIDALPMRRIGKAIEASGISRIS